MKWILLPVLFASCSTLPAQDPAPPEPKHPTEEIRRYIERLGSKNASICLDAVEYIPYFGTEAIPFLIEALQSDNTNRKALSAMTLAKLPHRSAVEDLIPLLDEKGALELNVLSDDGNSLHPAYTGGIPKFVSRQAKTALRAITGKSFSTSAHARSWWDKNKTTFSVRKPQKTLPPSLPLHARYLKGLRICIDPGHGGDTHKRGFKRGVTYLSEAEVNLRVARFLRDLLLSAGAKVTMTREGDTLLSLKERAEMAKGHDLFLSIHHNWSPNLRSQATSTWYHLTPDQKPAAIDLARYLQRNVFREMDLPEWPSEGGLMSDALMYKSGFGILRNLPREVPGVVSEMTYYSNLQMERKLRDLSFNQQEAKGLFLGLAEYFYYAIPRAELIESTPEKIRFQVYDGLEGRKAWTIQYKIFSDHIITRIEGTRTPHEYDPQTGIITVPHTLAPGTYSATISLINIHKNHSLPKAIPFTIPQAR